MTTKAMTTKATTIAATSTMNNRAKRCTRVVFVASTAGYDVTNRSPWTEVDYMARATTIPEPGRRQRAAASLPAR